MPNTITKPINIETFLIVYSQCNNCPALQTFDPALQIAAIYAAGTDTPKVVSFHRTVDDLLTSAAASDLVPHYAIDLTAEPDRAVLNLHITAEISSHDPISTQLPT